MSGDRAQAQQLHSTANNATSYQYYQQQATQQQFLPQHSTQQQLLTGDTYYYQPINEGGVQSQHQMAAAAGGFSSSVKKQQHDSLVCNPHGDVDLRTLPSNKMLPQSQDAKQHAEEHRGPLVTSGGGSLALHASQQVPSVQKTSAIQSLKSTETGESTPATIDIAAIAADPLSALQKMLSQGQKRSATVTPAPLAPAPPTGLVSRDANDSPAPQLSPIALDVRNLDVEEGRSSSPPVLVKERTLSRETHKHAQKAQHHLKHDRKSLFDSVSLFKNETVVAKTSDKVKSASELKHPESKADVMLKGTSDRSFLHKGDAVTRTEHKQEKKEPKLTADNEKKPKMISEKQEIPSEKEKLQILEKDKSRLHSLPDPSKDQASKEQLPSVAVKQTTTVVHPVDPRQKLSKVTPLKSTLPNSPGETTLSPTLEASKPVGRQLPAWAKVKPASKPKVSEPSSPELNSVATAVDSSRSRKPERGEQPGHKVVTGSKSDSHSKLREENKILNPERSYSNKSRDSPTSRSSSKLSDRDRRHRESRYSRSSSRDHQSDHRSSDKRLHRSSPDPRSTGRSLSKDFDSRSSSKDYVHESADSGPSGKNYFRDAAGSKLSGRDYSRGSSSKTRSHEPSDSKLPVKDYPRNYSRLPSKDNLHESTDSRLPTKDAPPEPSESRLSSKDYPHEAGGSRLSAKDPHRESSDPRSLNKTYTRPDSFDQRGSRDPRLARREGLPRGDSSRVGDQRSLDVHRNADDTRHGSHRNESDKHSLESSSHSDPKSQLSSAPNNYSRDRRIQQQATDNRDDDNLAVHRANGRRFSYERKPNREVPRDPAPDSSLSQHHIGDKDIGYTNQETPPKRALLPTPTEKPKTFPMYRKNELQDPSIGGVIDKDGPFEKRKNMDESKTAEDSRQRPYKFAKRNWQVRTFVPAKPREPLLPTPQIAKAEVYKVTIKGSTNEKTMQEIAEKAKLLAESERSRERLASLQKSAEQKVDQEAGKSSIELSTQTESEKQESRAVDENNLDAPAAKDGEQKVESKTMHETITETINLVAAAIPAVDDQNGEVKPNKENQQVDEQVASNIKGKKKDGRGRPKMTPEEKKAAKIKREAKKGKLEETTASRVRVATKKAKLGKPRKLLKSAKLKVMTKKDKMSQQQFRQLRKKKKKEKKFEPLSDEEGKQVVDRLHAMHKRKPRDDNSRGPFIKVYGNRDTIVSEKVVNNVSNQDGVAKKHRHGSRHLKLHNRDTKNWFCVLCGKRSLESSLGVLFGPYNVDNTNTEPSKKHKHSEVKTPSRKRVLNDLSEVWMHQSCAIWSPGIYLVGHRVHGLKEAVTEGQQMVCSVCKQPGATIGCMWKKCEETYHYDCARRRDCVMDEETFSLECRKHRGKRTKRESEPPN